MSTIAQICDRAQLLAMGSGSDVSGRLDSDWIAELLYPSVMKKCIIDAGNDPYKSKDVRITQNITVTSGVGTLPTNVALECLETANVLATGAATWATTDVQTYYVTVAGAGTAAANGVYSLRGTTGNGANYYTLVGQPTSSSNYAIVFNGTAQWCITSSIGDTLYISASTGILNPWSVTFAVADGSAPAPNAANTGDVSTITITGHALTTGERVTVSTTSALPSPLVINTEYYVIVVDDNTIQLAESYEDAIAGTNIELITIGAGTGTLTPQTVPVASYVRDYNDYLRPLPDVFSYWTTQGGSFYYRLIPSLTARARTSFTGTIPFNSVVFPIISSNTVSIVAGTALAEDICDDIVAELASAIRGEVSIKEASSAA